MGRGEDARTNQRRARVQKEERWAGQIEGWHHRSFSHGRMGEIAGKGQTKTVLDWLGAMAAPPETYGYRAYYECSLNVPRGSNDRRPSSYERTSYQVALHTLKQVAVRRCIIPGTWGARWPVPGLGLARAWCMGHCAYELFSVVHRARR